ncbi:MAG: DUF4405 domain-containing protein [Phycisphaerae bacterium]|nr:DUF4405 domain-containing protein [Phycisphaerae bacterium]
MKQVKIFQFRAFVSLLAAFSFATLAVTGVILYITPPGRIANWTNWTFWALNKQQWIGLHTCFATLFFIVSVLHIWLNFKPLISYFVNKAQAASKFRVEWLLAIIVCGIVFAGAMKPFAPFSSLLNLNDRIKFSWEEPKQRAPVPHAELLTIEELAKAAGMEPDIILQNLNAGGIETNISDIFGTIAKENGFSPNELFAIATGTTPQTRGFGYRGGDHAGQGQQGGFGQKTLQVACDEMNLNIQKAIDILKAAEIEAVADKTIRQIADENGVHPSRIRQILENQ